MAQKFNKGGASSDMLGAREMEGPNVWAVYPHERGETKTKDGPIPSLRCEVYQISADGTAERKGSALFFQTVLLKLPLEEWSVGTMNGPESGQRYFSLEWPTDTRWDAATDKAMAALPEHPDIPDPEEGPFD